ncbi:unnamed protein product [Ostreobium quekettii]|uniref:RRM domain-containing protein n=1 Tax=Ostreobium quekettii TaxID=121088 RepID=A0A8S1J4B3_9CHLO|nr:unnamed protein product [Ostreobium quekettii]|eukprot:evm.model.scf_1257.3 EVM.evm.TU.scf_1257.3   scf_1257:29620-36253(-)
MASLEAELARFESELAQCGAETQQVGSVAAGASGAFDGGPGQRPPGRLPPPKMGPPPSQVGAPQKPPGSSPGWSPSSGGPPPAVRPRLMAPTQRPPPPMPPQGMTQEGYRPMHPPGPLPMGAPRGPPPPMAPHPGPAPMRPPMGPMVQAPGPGMLMPQQGEPGQPTVAPGGRPYGHGPMVPAAPMAGPAGPGGPSMGPMARPTYTYSGEGYYPYQQGMAGSAMSNPANTPAATPNPSIAAPAQVALPSEDGAKGSKDAAEGAEAKKRQAVARKAAGVRWFDETLMDWPDDDHRIFVGDLGNEVNDDILAKAFSKYPSFYKAKVVRDKRTNKTKGYGFVSFMDANDFAKALKEMQAKYIGNRPCKLSKSSWRERNDSHPRRKYKPKPPRERPHERSKGGRKMA